jgi:N-acetylglutamate synthase-like GNAT family acetyltransferase
MGTSDIQYRDQRQPGDDQLIVDLHRLGYAYEGERFVQPFWEFVAETVAEAQLDQPSRSKVWFAERDGEALGCAALVDRGDIGQLRWVVVLPAARGIGAGRKLVDFALDHARACGHSAVFLETTDGLAASMAIYERVGFETTKQHLEPLWHGEGMLVEMTLPLR